MYKLCEANTVYVYTLSMQTSLVFILLYITYLLYDRLFDDLLLSDSSIPKRCYFFCNILYVSYLECVHQCTSTVQMPRYDAEESFSSLCGAYAQG